MEKEIGRIIGTTTLKRFMFAVSENGEENVKKDEFISAIEPVSGKEVIGIVKELTASNQLLPDEFARESAMGEFVSSYGIEDGEYLVGIVDILGHLNGGDSLSILKSGLRPGAPVYLAKNETIESLLKIDSRVAIPVGSVDARPDVSVPLDANKLVSTHSAILAMTGAGKSYTGGVIIEELLKKGGAILILDPHGEYKYLGFKSDGSKSDIHDKVKVFGVGKIAKVRLKIKANALSAEDISAMSAGTTDSQRDLLYAIIEVCRKKKRDYTLKDMIEVLSMTLEKKGVQKETEGEDLMASDLSASLERLAKKAHVSTINALIRRLDSLSRSGLVSDKETPITELVRTNQATVIDLSGVPDSIKEIVASAIGRKLFYSRMNHLNGYSGESLDVPCLFVIEEAHNFIPRDFDREVVSRNILRRIAREGRKFGIGLCMISQRPSRLDQDVLSQAGTQIIMRIVNPLDQDFIRKSAESVTEDIIRDLPALGRGEAIITGAAIRFPMKVKIKARDTKPGGDDIDIIGAWNSKKE